MPAAFALGTSEAIAPPSRAPSMTMPWYFFDVMAFWNWEYCFCGLNAASNTARSTPSFAAAALAPRRFAEFPVVDPAPIKKEMCTFPPDGCAPACEVPVEPLVEQAARVIAAAAATAIRLPSLILIANLPAPRLRAVLGLLWDRTPRTAARPCRCVPCLP